MTIKKVILYFEDEQDALRFTVAASSVISEGKPQVVRDSMRLIQPLARASRIRVARGATHPRESAAV
jgi:hypothetical protein